MAEFIVAIELGSSKITGIAGKKKLDGSISVLAVVKEDATQCIRKGVVYNIDKTGQCLTGIINKLRKQLKYEISQVYVGVGGQSIRSVRNVIVKDLALRVTSLISFGARLSMITSITALRSLASLLPRCTLHLWPWLMPY